MSGYCQHNFRDERVKVHAVIIIPWLAPWIYLLSEFEDGEKKTGRLVHYFY